MPRTKKPTTLRVYRGTYQAYIYRPDGVRTTVSFGRVVDRPPAEVHQAFATWLKLWHGSPQDVLSYGSPYAAVKAMTGGAGITVVSQLFTDWIAWAQEHYAAMRDGRDNPIIRRAKLLQKCLGQLIDWPLADFGPRQLEQVQGRLVDYSYQPSRRNGTKTGTPKRLIRQEINRIINVAHSIWAWAGRRSLVSQQQVDLLKETKPLRAGKTTAPNATQRERITDQEFHAVTQAVSSVLAAMMQTQWHTAMRPDETCRMRTHDLLMDQKCWLYIPGREDGPTGDHKTAWRGRLRVIPIPPRVQAILAPYIDKANPMAYLFRPVQAVREFMVKRGASRKTPLSCGNRPGSHVAEHPMIQPGQRYSPGTYRNAVKRGCKRAGVPLFSPYDLRPTAATRIRAMLGETGKKSAQTLLGHTLESTTDIYLLQESQEAMKVAMQIEQMEAAASAAAPAAGLPRPS